MSELRSTEVSKVHEGQGSAIKNHEVLLTKTISFQNDLNYVITLFQKENAKLSKLSREFTADWDWNNVQDTIYSHRVEPLSHVVHVFHREWHGIRAACGSLPGIKLAISERILPDESADILVHDIISRNPSHVIFHGYSLNAEKLILGLRQSGTEIPLYIIFHGSPAQWWNEVERELAFSAIECARLGHVKGLHFMKNGMELPTIRLFKPMLFNLSPLHRMRAETVSRSDHAKVFIPGWGNWIKNVFGTAYGASLSTKVQEVWAYAAGLQLPAPLDEKLKLLTPADREMTFERYLKSNITMNVSLIDCHPMVNVESQSVGRPCIRGDLNLDALEDHPYVKLVSVRHNNSPTDIRDTVDRVLSVEHYELQDMISDYQLKIDNISLQRYAHFLEI